MRTQADVIELHSMLSAGELRGLTAEARQILASGGGASPAERELLQAVAVGDPCEVVEVAWRQYLAREHPQVAVLPRRRTRS